VEQPFRRHDHSSGAVPALKGLVVEECLLDRIKILGRPQAFDSLDIGSLDIECEHEARADGPAPDENSA
jgi:hypothetical protein